MEATVVFRPHLIPHKLKLYPSNSASSWSDKPSKFSEEKKKRRDGDTEKETITSGDTANEGEDGDIISSKQIDESGDKRRKKKRKRNQVNDLRFETLMGNTKSSEKKYLEAKKKKNKKSKTEDNLDFPGSEQIEFGDVVQAPPKLVTLPKVQKNFPDASQERVRLQAIESCRKRKGWTSRLGLHLPDLNVTSSL